jgi:predicted LPLAT superfamily acyltransferase
MFPCRSRLTYSWLTYRLCCNFGMVLVERAYVGISEEASIMSDFPESDRMFDLMRTGRGVIIVNAHIGNWQMALSLLTESPVQINAHMRYDEGAAAKHWFDLQDRPCPFNIIRSDDTFGGMLEASAALLNGEAMVMMGDRWSPGTRGVEVTFMGGRVRMPVSPYYLASATGALVIVLFSASTGRRSYRVDIVDVMDVHPDVKNDAEKLAAYAARYAELLEDFVRKYPLQWYNFYDYWGE